MPAHSPPHRRTRAAFAVLAASAVVACAESAAPTAPAVSDANPATIASAPAPTKQQAKYEIDFMTDMIDHHMMAVMMSQLCVQKAIHQELRDLCTQIIAAQLAEIAQMQQWLQEWYGISYQPEMKPGAMQRMERMAAMSPADFEVDFMKRMIRHHAMAVREGEHCQEKAYHTELIQMCQQIVQTQQQEIDLMQSWLCVWYGICHYYNGM